MNPKPLLILTAAIEATTGVALLAVPSLPATILLGSALDTSVGLIVGRVAGAAVLALGVACWLARHDGHGVATRGLTAAMLLYNLAVVVVLVYARLSLGLSGIGLWPAVVLHLVFAVWCVACLRPVNAPNTKQDNP